MPSSTSQLYSQLLKQARRGSRSALARVMLWCAPLVRDRAGVKLRNAPGAEPDPSDVAQDVITVATAKFGEFKGENRRTLLGWLYAILDNRIKQLTRHRRTRLLNAIDLDSTEKPIAGEQVFVDSGTSPSEQVSRKEECDFLVRAASWCREEDMTLITMRLHEELSYAEIGARLDITEVTARQRYSRAIRQVREARTLLALMSQRGLSALQQDVIGLHRFRKADPAQIAQQFGVRRGIVERWIAEAADLIRRAKEETDEPAGAAGS